MEYYTRAIPVDAEQWQPGKVLPDVEEIPPMLTFSRDGKYYYLANVYPGGRLVADAWLEVEAGKGPNGPVLPFSFWSVKSGEEKPAAKGEPLTDRYLAHIELADLPAPYALLTIGVTASGSPERKTVNAGDWIVRREGKPPEVWEDAAFEAAFETR